MKPTPTIPRIHLEEAYCPQALDNTLDDECGHEFDGGTERNDRITFNCAFCLGSVAFEVWD